MLDFGLGGTASPGHGQLLARRVVGSASVRDVEAEGLAGGGGKDEMGRRVTILPYSNGVIHEGLPAAIAKLTFFIITPICKLRLKTRT